MLYLFHKTFERKRPKETVIDVLEENEMMRQSTKESEKQNVKKYIQKTKQKKEAENNKDRRNTRRLRITY